MTNSNSKSTKVSGWFEPCKIISVTKSDGPQGNNKKDWYRYVISQGNDPIVGFRRGTRESVVAAAEEVVFCLNERLVGKPGRVHVKLSKKH
jgi:hypothetical protein